MTVPVDHARLAAQDRDLREGRFRWNSADPYMIAGRPVASHGSDSVLATGYQLLSLPGIAAGELVDELVWDLVFWNSFVAERTRWARKTAKGQSWLLAASLYTGTSAWWVFSAWLTGLLYRQCLAAVARRKGDAG